LAARIATGNLTNTVSGVEAKKKKLYVPPALKLNAKGKPYEDIFAS